MTNYFLPTLLQAVVQSYVEKLTNYRILTTASPFDRRVTAMQWHPTLPSTVAVGSKGGDLILWDFAKTEGITFMKGVSTIRKATLILLFVAYLSILKNEQRCDFVKIWSICYPKVWFLMNDYILSVLYHFENIGLAFIGKL